MRIGIYGGTFDPPHMGHLNSARLAMKALQLDKLIFIPTAIPPHKAMPDNAPTPQERLEMLRIAVDGLLLGKRAEVCDLELRREGKSYTADTLRHLKEQYPEDELWLLMGTDMFLTLQQWHEPEVICRLAHLGTFARSRTDSMDRLNNQKVFLEKMYGARARILDLGEITPVSSTQIRHQLEVGEPGPELPIAVYGYILRNNLYGKHVDLKHLTVDQLRACSYSMMRAKRHRHVHGVEQEAIKLAHRWGADEKLAQRAAILHDCTKYYTLEEDLQVCKRCGIELDELEQQSVKLLHSKTGAAMARYVYGQSDEIYEAIFWHTTGKADMSLLEKVIYLADYIEPSRDFEGVDKLRRLCYEDIDAGLELALSMSIEELKGYGTPVHKNTRAALEWQRSLRKGTAEQPMSHMPAHQGGKRLEQSQKREPRQKKQKSCGNDKKPEEKHKKPEGKHPGFRKFYIVLTVISAIIVAAFLFWHIFTAPPDLPDSPKPTTTTQVDEEGNVIEVEVSGELSGRKEQVYTFLLVGQDTMGGGNTDTMMLGTYDVPNQNLNVMSLPRDTYVNYSGNDVLLNSVFNYGGGHKDVDRGIEALKSEVGELTGIIPDYHVIVQWDAVGELVEAIDGIDFDVPRRMNYWDPTQDLRIDLQPGMQHLNGSKAMQLIRWRHNNDGSGYATGDLGRIQTQQEFMKAVIAKCLQPNVLLPNLAEYIRIFQNNVITDMSASDMAYFAKSAVGKLDMADVSFKTLPNKNAGDGAHLLPVGSEIVELVNESFNPYLEDIRLSDLDLVLKIRLPERPTHTPTPTEEPEESEEPAESPNPSEEPMFPSEVEPTAKPTATPAPSEVTPPPVTTPEPTPAPVPTPEPEPIPTPVSPVEEEDEVVLPPGV